MIRWITDPSPPGLFLFLTFMFLFSGAAIAYSDVSEVDRIEKSIKWLLRKNPRHRLVKSQPERHKFAKDIITKANKYDLSPYLLTSIIYLESTFRTDARGKIGEHGLTQVHGMAAYGCDLSTQGGQIECGARYLRSRIDHCGDVRSGLTAYAGGRCRAKYGERLYWVVERRLRLATKLRKLD
jgi:soluble lytic murein transglycosylase-like protein